MTSPHTPPTLPTQARVVVVGGGIAGCSNAYHLARLGLADVLLLEQGRLTSGTTWHAAGLVGQMRPNRNQTRMSKYGIELYSTLEAETGLATGWKPCGSVNVARTPERMKVLKRQVALAKSFGVEVHPISPKEAGDLYPVMRTDDLQGAIWIPGDGKANPADLCMSLAKGARNRGVRMVEILVNCAGQWARQFGALAGVTVPLFPAEHFYIVTDRIDGVHPMLPVMRDPDGYIYYKEEVGGLLMGGFEPVAKPWRVDPIPADFQFQLLGEDWEQFEILMTNAIHRTPCLETAKVKMLLNGPESFTPDGNFILGEAPELRGYFVCAGFNSAGIANSGGAGRRQRPCRPRRSRAAGALAGACPAASTLGPDCPQPASASTIPISADPIANRMPRLPPAVGPHEAVVDPLCADLWPLWPSGATHKPAAGISL